MSLQSLSHMYSSDHYLGIIDLEAAFHMKPISILVNQGKQFMDGLGV